jgi:hypothetical protein
VKPNSIETIRHDNKR